MNLKLYDMDHIDMEFKSKFELATLPNLTNDIDIASEKDAKQALSMALQARKMKKSIEETRKEITKPHFDYQKSINKFAKAISNRIEEIELSLITKLNCWVEEENENPFYKIDKMEVEDGSLTLTKDYDFIITDESLIDRKYFVLDKELIKKDIDAGLRKMQGIEINEINSVSIRIKN